MVPDADRVGRLQRTCLDEHLLVYAGGWHASALVLVPPLVIDEADLGAALDRIVALVGKAPRPARNPDVERRRGHRGGDTTNTTT